MDYMRDYGARELDIRRTKVKVVADAPTDDWKARATATYDRHRQHEDVALRTALAERIHTLTGHVVGGEAIVVDVDSRVASTVVDGIRFRWKQTQLVVLRPCALCGGGQFESPSITHLHDLGYALTAWQPRHSACEPEDPANWLESTCSL